MEEDIIVASSSESIGGRVSQILLAQWPNEGI